MFPRQVIVGRRTGVSGGKTLCYRSVGPWRSVCCGEAGLALEGQERVIADRRLFGGS
jgi:hypothetical protein